jgi:8-oxo-dGTP pyrophosphatase MutT (NUDIX family)
MLSRSSGGLAAEGGYWRVGTAPAQPGRGWQNLGEAAVVDTPWFQLKLAQVALPGRGTIDHYLLRLPPVVLTTLLDEQDRVLLLWRHRFIPDSWGWELPSGIATDPAEDLADVASRQALAESGWQPIAPRPLLTLEPYSSLTDSVCHVFWTERAVFRGEPTAAFEAERIEWVPLSDVPALVADGQIKAASTAAALLHLCCGRAIRG